MIQYMYACNMSKEKSKTDEFNFLVPEAMPVLMGIFLCAETLPNCP